MQLISCHNGRLTTTLAEERMARPPCFTTGQEALDSLLPHGGFVRGAVHEVLCHPRHGVPRFFALLLARAAGGDSGAIVWCDPQRQLYPPAVAAMGFPLQRLYLLRPQSPRDRMWAIAECLRCKGVAATVAQVDKLSRLEARRLQLAAEQGDGAGILLRHLQVSSQAAAPQPPPVYAAATRWRVAPLRGQRTVQRWAIELIHGHGGRIGQTVILEHHRDQFLIQTRLLHPSAELADRSPAALASA